MARQKLEGSQRLSPIDYTLFAQGDQQLVGVEPGFQGAGGLTKTLG